MAIKKRLQAGSRSSMFTSPSPNSQVNGAAQFRSQAISAALSSQMGRTLYAECQEPENPIFSDERRRAANFRTRRLGCGQRAAGRCNQQARGGDGAGKAELMDKHLIFLSVRRS